MTIAAPDISEQPVADISDLIGPIAPSAWDSDEPGDDTPADIEWSIRKANGEFEFWCAERAREREGRMARMRADREIADEVRENRLDAIARRCGLKNTIDLRRAAPKAANDNDKAVTATPFVWKDPAGIPRREWLYGSHYARKYLSATFGAGGGGKTAHSYSEALAMASGKPLLGEIPRQRRRVWAINLEDPAEEIDRRVMAAAVHFKLCRDDIEGYLWTDSGRDQRVVVARTEGRDIKIVEPVVQALIAEITARKIDVLIVDPFVSTHGVPENDNGAIQSVAEQWVRVAHEANCSVELVHHVRKSNGQEATADDGRGAGALKDKARSVRVVNSMTRDEAEKAGIPDDQIRRHFRVDFGKVNMVASASSAWRRFANVSLGNGAGPLDPADQIGVVEQWRWPSPDDVKAELPDGAFEALLRKLECGNYRESDQAIQWAGDAVAEVLRLDPKQPDDKRRIKGLLRSWLQSGDLQTVVKHDHKRVDRKYIVPAAAPPQ